MYFRYKFTFLTKPLPKNFRPFLLWNIHTINRAIGSIFAGQVGRVDMDTQLSWYNNTIQELTQQLGAAAAQQLLGTALYSVTIGANDYVNNYLVAGSPAAARYTPAQFQQLLLLQFSSQLTVMLPSSLLLLHFSSILCISPSSYVSGVQTMKLRAPIISHRMFCVLSLLGRKARKRARFSIRESLQNFSFWEEKS